MDARTEYEMTAADLAEILQTIKDAQSTPLIALNAGMPESPQAAANRAWKRLGDRMGFDHMTVQPTNKGDRFFTAVKAESTAVTPAE